MIYHFIPEKVYYMKLDSTSLSSFLKERRKKLNLTQKLLAEKAGVGLRFIRDLEQGKTTLRMDKVNQVLKLFGQVLMPQPINRDKLLN